MNNGVRVVLKMLEATPWFHNVGLHDAENVVTLRTWDEAIDHCTSIDWENVQIELNNTLAQSVKSKSTERFQHQWSNVLKEIKAITIPMVNRKTKDLVELELVSDRFLGAVNWDIVLIVQSVEYADFDSPPLIAQLAYWYLMGHFPCGWEGKYPKGKLIIY